MIYKLNAGVRNEEFEKAFECNRDSLIEFQLDLGRQGNEMTSIVVDKKEEIKQINKLWRESNPEAMKKARKNWMKKSYKYCPSFYRACDRCRKANVLIADTFEELHKIREFYKNCPEDMTVDHIVPISKGGSHTIDNLQYLSFRDNCRKSNKIV